MTSVGLITPRKGNLVDTNLPLTHSFYFKTLA